MKKTSHSVVFAYQSDFESKENENKRAVILNQCSHVGYAKFKVKIFYVPRDIPV